ncbi:GGDEF domain-containing protein [Croceicoccus sp. YJ47]|uniref:GGDEF domain-containing protein n=1 Tax=Croceicoccus sp. YJ47 TaxID=2798724 RepID=UPI001920A020|nr:GGDEF domain-containing protein [Croceicoccus sp. YJ47]QQN74912.1 GGDEF domain-containing protein [Croceicoccus sp. YJ47]
MLKLDAMFLGNHPETPALETGRGNGQRFDGRRFLKMSRYSLVAGLLLLTFLLFASVPTVAMQCGYVLLTAVSCWHFGSGVSRGVTLAASLVLALSAWLHGMPWEAYLLAPMVVISGEGMIRLRARYDDAELAANVDRLTGALTPRGFAKMLGRELRSAQKQNRTTALIFLDLDHFKQVNDRYGHAEGDRVLSQVAGALREVLLEDDHIARIGGDEFLVFLRFADDPERLDDCQRLLIRAIDTLPWQVTASAGGIVVPPGQYPEPSTLIRLADNLMYDVKRSGRGRLDLQHLSDLDGSRGHSTALERASNAEIDGFKPR